MVGTSNAEKISLSSTAHGAGRIMSRAEAISSQKGEEVRKKLEAKGILVNAGSVAGLSEEAPEAYKNIDEVVKISDELGIGKLVAKLKPLAVMKG
jgi:tRNA-splicing ligase RtcB